MNKKLLALAVLGTLATYAVAESQVTLYGVIDEGLSLSKSKGSAATVSVASGDWYGSRWGIRGFEDLGNGNVVGFQLEQGFNVNNGTVGATGNTPSGSSAMFSRISRLYVKGDWGEFGMGRWGTLSSGTGPYDMLYTWLGDGQASFGETNAWDVIAGIGGRANNSIVYVSPDWAGFQFKLMYANGIQKDTEQWSKNQHYYGIGLQYKAHGLQTALIFDVKDQKGLPLIPYVDYEGVPGKAYFLASTDNGTDWTLTNNLNKPIYSLTFGIGYDFDYFKPQFGYTWVQQTDIASQHTFGLSTGIPIAGGDFNIGVRYVIGTISGKLKRVLQYFDERTTYGLFTVNAYYSYPLSKRTTLYGYAGYTNGNKFLSAVGTITNPFNGAKVNTNGYAIQIGMKHTF